MVWGGMTGRSLTLLHFMKQGQTVMADYITKILQKEVSPHFSGRSTTEEPVKRKLFTNKSSATFVEDGTSTSSYSESNPAYNIKLESFHYKLRFLDSFHSVIVMHEVTIFSPGIMGESIWGSFL